ncbi:MAG: hypothetical protein Q7T48_01740 [Cellvibrio sp.]|uniref:DUF7379 domain-containing protein n=1 Tax=Cellvibrio sp. TaxID=1965322 RepID=UPI002717FD79|nr:hypothetical protein [Cellvibrio sp.]
MAITVKASQGHYVNWGERAGFIGSPSATIDYSEIAESLDNTFTNVLADLASADFRHVTPMLQVDSMLTDVKALGKKHFGMALLDNVPSLRVQVTTTDDEKVVLLEFDAETGDITGWRDEKEIKTPAMGFAENFSGNTAIFDLPLLLPKTAMNYAVHNGKGYPKSFVPGAKKVFALFSVPLEKLVGSALTPLFRLLEQSIKKKELLQWLDADMQLPEVTTPQRVNMQGKNVLLFVHGIISSTQGAFDDLVKIGNCYESLHQKYEGNLIAYDHWTLGKSCLDNAWDLARELPAGVTLDIICHSRGAGVVRALLELPELQNELAQKGIGVGKVCFVAGACEGSALARRETVQRLFKVFAATNYLARAKVPNMFWVQLIKLLLRGIQELPGTDSMDPDNDFIKTQLKESQKTLASHYYYIRANFEAKGMLANVLDENFIDEIVFQKNGNDVVVPFEGAGKNDNYLKNRVEKTNLVEFPLLPIEENSIVWHINFFEQKEVQTALQLTFAL